MSKKQSRQLALDEPEELPFDTVTYQPPPKRLSQEKSVQLLASARDKHQRALRQFNAAVVSRAEAAWNAHHVAGLSWQMIADHLEISRPVAIDLAQRYERAIASGQPLGISNASPRRKRNDG